MMRFEALVLERDERAALSALGRLGAVQLEPSFPNRDLPLLGASERREEKARCDRILSRVADLQRSLNIVLEPGSSEGIALDAAEPCLAQWENRVGQWARQREQCQRRLFELQGLSDQIAPFQSLDLPLEAPSSASFLHFVTGSLPAGVVDILVLPGTATVFPFCAPARGRQPIVAVSLSAFSASLETALQEAGFEERPLPVEPGRSTGTLFAAIERERRELDKELLKLDEERRRMADAVAVALPTIQNAVVAERRLLEAEEINGHTAASVLITGWIPKEAVPVVERALQTSTQASCVVNAHGPDACAEQEIPVLLRASGWTAPFQTLLTAYGFPGYRDVVPTAFVAASYPVMFGMMFGDVGHGLVLALAGAGLRFFRPKQFREAAVLLLVNGLSSMVFGMVYGSYFGAPALKTHALWHDPLECEPIALMLGAIAVGVVLMSTGLLLNIINRLRRGEFVAGLLDKFGLAGLVFYWGTLSTLALGYTRGQKWSAWSVGCFLIAPLACWVLREPLEQSGRHRANNRPDTSSWAATVAESLVGAFEGVLLYLANTVSFVRLAAYAMSHAALLLATFALADQVRSLTPGGAALATAVVIVGNVLALVLEGIVAAVQALRLEYYEFFGKFFSGEGRPFKPFSLVTEMSA